MNLKFSNTFWPALPVILIAAILMVCLGQPSDLSARPRPPGPPYPDFAPILFSESFDEPFLAGATNDEVVVSGVGTFMQSWSGYALQRMGDVTPFVMPGVETNGWTNVSCASQGAFRFWIKPYWCSSSVTNGENPGAIATVLELDAVSGGSSAVAWSLQVSSDGNTLALFSQTDSGLQEVLSTSIAWAAGTSHCVIVDWNSTGTALYVDGSVAATGSTLASIPPSTAELVVGSTLAGTNSAGADMDEFYSFGKPLSADDIAAYYVMTEPIAALGPWSDHWTRPVHHRIAPFAELAPVYEPSGGCPTGGLPYLTNFAAVVASNGATTISFGVAGGTNGIFYDVYYLTNIKSFIDQSSWTFAGEVLTCQDYIWSNQTPSAAFYFITTPVLLTVRAWGDNTYGQCNVPLDLTNAAAVSAGCFYSLVLEDNGEILAFGDNRYGQTNIPNGITNASAISAGAFHGLVLLSNGVTQMWGSYFDGSNFIPVTNYTGIAPPTSNVMAIAAGVGSDLALLSNGTVVSFGLTNIYTMTSNALAFQSNLSGVAAIGSGWNHNSVLLSNGTIKSYGFDVRHYQWDLTNAPSGSNFVGLSVGPLQSMALRSNGTALVWGASEDRLDVISNLTGLVAVSAGYDQTMAIGYDGTFIICAPSNSIFNGPPSDLFGVKAVSGGLTHTLAIASSRLPPLETVPPQGFAPYGDSLTFSIIGLFITNVSYQWQFNGTNISGATNATLTLSSVNSTDNGNYDVVISNANGTVTSLAASFAVAQPPLIDFTSPQTTNVNWINQNETLSVSASAVGQLDYPLSYQWQFNGTNISGATNSAYSIYNIIPTNEGSYTVIVTNALGSTNATFVELLALPGMAENWGDNSHGECNRPASLTNALSIAAGAYHSVVVTDSNTIQQWGQLSDGTNFYTLGSPPSGSNFLSVAASRGHDLALTSSGSVTNWGLTNDPANFVPTNLPPIQALACGLLHNVAITMSNTLVAWGDNSHGQLNIPADLTNGTVSVKAIAAGDYFTVALRSDGSLEAFGDNTYGQTNIPANATNISRIGTGSTHCLALNFSGAVIAWGNNGSGQTNVPLSAKSNILNVAGGSGHSVAQRNDGVLIEWGSNSNGQATPPTEPPGLVTDFSTAPPSLVTNPPVAVKLIAAGGNHTMAAVWSPLVQYPVDVSEDLLLIYNTNSLDSSNVCMYYLTNRPMVSNANILGIGCTTLETITPSDFTNNFERQITNWLYQNPTKRPSYVILFQDIPSRVNPQTAPPQNYETFGSDPYPSVQYQLHYTCLVNWEPFVTSINMNGSNSAAPYNSPVYPDTNYATNLFSSDGTVDCIAYINKLTNVGNMGGNVGQLIISGLAAGIGNTNWYFDDSTLFKPGALGAEAELGVSAIDPAASIFYSSNSIITAGTNVAGYYSPGIHNLSFSNGYATNGQLVFHGDSGWFLIDTDESFNGERYNSFQGLFVDWFASNAFGGANYSNTPVGAGSNVDEPGTASCDPSQFFGHWAQGKNLAVCGWNSINPYGSLYIQVVGDPFTKW